MVLDPVAALVPVHDCTLAIGPKKRKLSTSTNPHSERLRSIVWKGPMETWWHAFPLMARSFG